MNGEDFFSSTQWIEELSVGDNNDSDGDLVEVVSPLLREKLKKVKAVCLGERKGEDNTIFSNQTASKTERFHRERETQFFNGRHFKYSLILLYTS